MDARKNLSRVREIKRFQRTLDLLAEKIRKDKSAIRVRVAELSQLLQAVPTCSEDENVTIIHSLSPDCQEYLRSEAPLFMHLLDSLTPEMPKKTATKTNSRNGRARKKSTATDTQTTLELVEPSPEPVSDPPPKKRRGRPRKTPITPDGNINPAS